MRGGSSSYNISYIWDIVCTWGYDSGKFSHSRSDLKCGTCTYQGEKWIAVQLGSEAAFDIVFSGLYTDNCNFKIVNMNEVTWWN